MALMLSSYSDRHHRHPYGYSFGRRVMDSITGVVAYCDRCLLWTAA